MELKRTAAKMVRQTMMSRPMGNENKNIVRGKVPFSASARPQVKQLTKGVLIGPTSNGSRG